jgi:hypothetical protein
MGVWAVGARGPGEGGPNNRWGGFTGFLSSGDVLASGGLGGNGTLYSSLAAARNMSTGALNVDVPGSCGGIRDKGGGVLRAGCMAPFLSPADGFDAHDRRFGALGGNLFGGGVLAADAGAI